MCFTPAISLGTAIIEFGLAGIMFFVFRKSKLRNFFTVFILLLGLYQFSEFMLCTSFYPKFWAVFGFIAYSLLPAVGLHSALFFTNKKRNLFLLYVIPVAASIFAFVFSSFITVAQCDRVFVTVKTVFSPSSSFLFAAAYYVYAAYYFLFIIAIGLVLLHDAKRRKIKIFKEMDIIVLFGIGLMTIPTFILVVIFPSFNLSFPSVLCEFAVFVAITLIIAMYLHEKIRPKKRKRR